MTNWKQRLFRSWVVFTLVWIPSILTAYPAETDTPVCLKAFYVYNLILFTEWPDGDLVPDKFHVGVAGDHKLYERLKRLSGKMSQGRRLVVKRIKTVQDLSEPCAVLFIGASEKGQVPKFHKVFKDMPTLTVSDMKGFTEMGGMIRLKNICHPATATNKRFEINVSVVEQAGLHIRSKVLRLADIVNHP